MSYSLFHSHYYIHVHLQQDENCYWYSRDTRYKDVLVSRDFLHAEAVKLEDVTFACAALNVRYKCQEISAHPCVNDCLTDDMKRVMRLV